MNNEKNKKNNESEVNFGFKGNILICGKIVCDTGLHIGDSNDSLEIGGIDNMVIRDKESDLPYIPGSSLKGKLRFLLELNDQDSTKYILTEYETFKKKGANACQCGECVSCHIFGFTNSDDAKFKGPTRIIVRDALPDDDTKSFWKNSDDISRGTELKVENRIDRIEGTAKDPRPTERVPRTSKFDLNIVFSIYCDEDKDNFKHIFRAFELLEDSYLGGNGSRGYGQVHFEELSIYEKPKSYYTGEKSKNHERLFNCNFECSDDEKHCKIGKYNIEIKNEFEPKFKS
ncbi:MAG: type III-A CRISPR-associated RAMP protein Csm3 [Methanobrevibacter sp.]|jgi:CRISPR-associated protein Csm3|nr:type III-A CRISPR-associated RAMP protein Csm3 [Candidatus Methanoflexus mossambicus]